MSTKPFNVLKITSIIYISTNSLISFLFYKHQHEKDYNNSRK